MVRNTWLGLESANPNPNPNPNPNQVHNTVNVPVAPMWRRKGQEAPTKGEWKTLSKLFVQRRKAGESEEGLSVLAEALRASGNGPLGPSWKTSTRPDAGDGCVIRWWMVLAHGCRATCYLCGAVVASGFASPRCSAVRRSSASRARTYGTRSAILVHIAWTLRWTGQGQPNAGGGRRTGRDPTGRRTYR